MSVISLCLPDEISARLDHLAEATGQTKTDIAIEAICEHLEDLEDLYVAETRWREFQKSKSKAIPLQEIVDEYLRDD